MQYRKVVKILYLSNKVIQFTSLHFKIRLLIGVNIELRHVAQEHTTLSINYTALYIIQLYGTHTLLMVNG